MSPLPFRLFGPALSRTSHNFFGNVRWFSLSATFCFDLDRADDDQEKEQPSRDGNDNRRGGTGIPGNHRKRNHFGLSLDLHRQFDNVFAVFGKRG